MNISIRNEVESDYRKVEELTREAFWNLYVPGCDEHYLVHKMRTHPDFIKELDFVAIHDGEIIGNIMFTKSFIVDEANTKLDTLTFGPIGVLPEYQRKGVGTALINHSIKIALEHNYKVVIIEGHPHNYCKHGFKVSKDYNISNPEGKYPYSLLVLELEKGFIGEDNWKYHSSDVYKIDSEGLEEYDKQFPFKEKEYKYSQYEFLLSCRAYVE
ncbi:GNAT family N-acetyltransferase [Natronospora cellulosivora (SeqCode)]